MMSSGNPGFVLPVDGSRADPAPAAPPTPKAGGNEAALRAPKRPGLSGHARLLAAPAYRRLLAAEPHLKRLIPLLILAFLVMVGLARFAELYSQKMGREADARAAVDMTSGILAAKLIAAEPVLDAQILGVAAENVVAGALPEGALRDGRLVLVTDAGGGVIASLPRQPAFSGKTLTDLLAQAQALVFFGERAGVQPVTIGEDEAALASLRHLSGKLGAVAVVQPMASAYAGWRGDVTLNVVIFIGTSAILLVLLYSYFAQASRAEQADRIYSATHERFDLALTRGRCGIFDWDLARGRMFWSSSMFEVLGHPPRDALLSFGEASAFLHPEDGNLMTLVEQLYASGEAVIDRVFRMRHVSGDFVWLRARAELVDRDSEKPHLIGIAVDISEQMRLAERSRTADIRLRDAIETVSEAFVIWDADNRLVMCNSKYQELYALAESDVRPGTPYAAVMAAARQPVVQAQVPAEGPPEEGARSFEAQLGDGRWLQINERRTKDGGFVSVGTDITQIKRHEEKLIDGERMQMATIADLRRSRQKLELQAQQMVELAEKYAEEKERAEAASRTKSEFLANISHELRTPLNAVIGFSEIMQNGLFGPLGSPKYVEYCGDILKSGTYLLGVINDILDMSRIEAGRLTLDLEDLHLDDIVPEALRITSEASGRPYEITCDVEPDMRFRADRRAIKQILLNLLSNATKFTPAGGKIGVRARRVEGAMIVTIADSGIGIAPDALKRLGRPFEQVQNQFTKSHKGSGLGLAITRSLVELHGGSMRILSREGKGTIVALRLPVEPRVAPQGASGRRETRAIRRAAA
ncbi:MAG: ATP-binding protein [Bauldia sp.]